MFIGGLITGLVVGIVIGLVLALWFGSKEHRDKRDW